MVSPSDCGWERRRWRAVEKVVDKAPKDVRNGFVSVGDEAKKIES
jgi:hypothetical protein